MIKKTLLSFSLGIFMITSCNKDKAFEQENFDKNLTKISTTDIQTFNNDTIIPLDSTKFPTKPLNKARSLYINDEDPYTHLSQLNGIEFFIQSKDSYFGKNTLQSYGKGQEIKLMPYSSTDQNQLFYLRFLPASSGIPYMIYSFKENAPVGVGSYSSSPNNYVLYTQAANSTSTFGFSWNFDINSSKDGYFFKSEDILGSGGSSPWDVYNYYLSTNNGNLTFNRKNSTSILQQFNIVPNDNFVIESITLDLNNFEIVNTSDVSLRDGSVTNNTSNNMTRTLQFSESKTESASFTQTSGITTRMSGNLNASVKLFEVLNIGSSFTLEESNQETLQYGQNSSRTIGFTESFNITVPPNKISSYSFRATRHLVNVAYKAKMRSVAKHKLIEISGVFSGVDYSSTSLIVNEYDINNALSKGATSATKTYTINPNKK